MRGIWRGVVGEWGGRCGRCLYGEISTVVGTEARRGEDVQKKRPFQILRSSMVVKVRPEQR